MLRLCISGTLVLRTVLCILFTTAGSIGRSRQNCYPPRIGGSIRHNPLLAYVRSGRTTPHNLIIGTNMLCREERTIDISDSTDASVLYWKSLGNRSPNSTSPLPFAPLHPRNLHGTLAQELTTTVRRRLYNDTKYR